MDEGDEYVPQISQLDYSLVGGGQAVLQNDQSAMYSGPQSQLGIHHMQSPYSDTTLMQQQRPIHSQMGGGLSMMPPQMTAAPAPPHKTKAPRRRKNAASAAAASSIEQPMMATTNLSSLPGAQPPQLNPQPYMTPPQATPPGGPPMTPMQSMAAMSQNPLMGACQMRQPPGMQPQMMAAPLKAPASDMQMRHQSMMAPPAVHDPYSQQQHWYSQPQQQPQQQQPQQQQQYRPGGYPQSQQMPYTQRMPPSHPIPQQSFYGPQQDSRVPPSYYQHQNFTQMPRYAQSIGVAASSSHTAQQYYSDSNQNYYAPQSHMMQMPQSQPMSMQGQPPPNHTPNEWHHANAQRYHSAQQHFPNNIQIEIQQVQQQLQSMYEIPNRNLQTAQQIEQLQLRLQYLQQYSVGECRAPPQRPPEQQPVSVMQRGSQVQVNIKPDVPGHTLISVYHQYPTNTPPTPSNPPAESLTPKDCVPPEPIPSTMRSTTVDETPANPLVNNGMMNTASGINSYGAAGGAMIAENGDAPMGMNIHPMNIYEQTSSQNQQPCLQNEIPPAVPTCLTRSETSTLMPVIHLQAPSPKKGESDVTEEVLSHRKSNERAITPPSEVHLCLQQEGDADEQKRLAPSPKYERSCAIVSSDINSPEEIEIPKGGGDIIEQQDTQDNETMDTSQKSTRSDGSKKSEYSTDEADNSRETEAMHYETSESHAIEANRSTLEDEETAAADNSAQVCTKAGIRSSCSLSRSPEQLIEHEADEESLKTEEAGGVELELERTDDLPETAVESSSGETTRDGKDTATSSVVGNVEEEDEDEEEDETKSSAEVGTEATPSRESTLPLEESRNSHAEMTSKRRAKPPRRALPKKRRRDEEEVSDEPADDDFVPEPAKRTRKKVRTKRREKDNDSFSDVPVEYVEKRRSGRTLGAEKKNYDLQAKWDEMEEELVEEDNDAPSREVKKEEPSEYIIEKVMSMKKSDKGADTYFVKYKNKAYIHCEWKTQEELEAGDKRAAAKLKRFLHKRAHSSDQDDDEQFNSDFVIVERVLDVSDDGEDKYALVKWRSLPYEDATWEKIDIIPSEKIDALKARNTVDSLKIKPRPRPSASEWRKIPEETTFKDDNTLREYQFEGVNWLLYCYYNRQNCILADEMGLGKTVQTICFLQRVYDYGIHGPFLIVVPLSTIHNWQREFETWTDMNAIIYHGSAASRQLIQQSEFYYRPDDQKISKKNVVKFDALITTFEMVVCDCDILRRINYHVCVIDEAHRLKNRNCKLLTGGLLSFTVEHRLLLTGTPLQNNIEELYSLLNFLEPEQFHSSSAFLEQFGQCQTEDQVQKLQEILKPMMLRRLKEDVEKTLQPKEETIIEIQLSNTQKKYYRAILERNFSHLCKGTSVPSLMNTMMELRKCCNHPFLINGAEEQIISEMKTVHPDWSEEELYQHALVQSSGKLVLIAKLLPKLRADGHKVLIFSQMVRVLDIIEEFLVVQNYTFERIDGNVRGDLRQTAIDRFSKKDSDRFVFLLCTRAGGLGINLTAADTVIIFDSDWNPQNDLQAQARCHRIGQTKMVKVYRLITCNTYEREMFDKASLKLGLDKAVLQSTTALKDTSQQLSRKEVEELLKKGAYGAIMEENNEDSKFNEEDIDTILQRRTTTITLEAGIKGSTFAKASFNSSTNREDIDIDDPNFWSKWAKKANIDTEMSQSDKELILLEPRNRKKRFEENIYKAEGGDDSEGEESDESGKGRKRGERKGDRKRRREDEEYRPDELAFNKSEYFKVEKLLAQYGWGRWKAMREASDLKESVSEADIEHISRTLLLHCIREYRGDEKVREFVWRLIIPKGGQVPGKAVTKKKPANNLTSVFHEGWAALPEFNPPAFAVDSSFQRHVHRHANKLLVRMHQLHILNTEVIGSRSEAIMSGAKADDIDLSVEMNEPFFAGWDAECDKNFLIGAHKHGVENYDAMRADEALCFASKSLETFPSGVELLARFRRLLMHFQRKRSDTLSALTWSKREEAEFMRVLRSYGVKDDPSTIISWTRFRQLSPLLEKKSDSELMEQLYCVLSMCTKQLGNQMSTVDLQRAMKVEPISARKAQKLMHRMNMMRQIHDWADSLTDRASLLKLCSSEAMPNGWGVEQDDDLFTVVDSNGLDNICANIAHRPAFQKIIRPEEKTLLRRIAEIYTTLQTKKWNGAASIELLEDSDIPLAVITER
uniref:Chromodomain-helicase-DNA-binding protein 8 n=1 Tax=Parascaris univalens TaxID=6257 RepID=A0A915AAX0_PARUN